jgi:hypothetical protein
VRRREWWTRSSGILWATPSSVVNRLLLMDMDSSSRKRVVIVL